MEILFWFSKKNFIPSLFICFILIFIFCSLYKGGIVVDEENHTFIISIIIILIVITILVWDLYLFIFIFILRVDIKIQNCNHSNINSYPEELFANPIFYMVTIYFFNNLYIKSFIDFCLWNFLQIHYFILKIFLNVLNNSFSDYIDNNVLKDEISKKKINLRYKIGSIYLLFINILILVIVMFIFNDVNDFKYKFSLNCYGIYNILKHIEDYHQKRKKFSFSIRHLTEKENQILKNYKHKFYLHFSIQLYIAFIFLFFSFGEQKHKAFSYVLGFLCAIQVGSILNDIIIFFNFRKYFNNLDKYFPKVEKKEEECSICTELLKESRKLKCNHCFHLICLIKWIEKGNKTCPLCRSNIDQFSYFSNNWFISNINNQQYNILNVIRRLSI